MEHQSHEISPLSRITVAQARSASSHTLRVHRVPSFAEGIQSRRKWAHQVVLKNYITAARQLAWRRRLRQLLDRQVLQGARPVHMSTPDCCNNGIADVCCGGPSVGRMPRK